MIKRINRTVFFGLLSLVLLSLVVLFPTSVLAHEPVFGLGPETIFQDGVGLEYEYEVEEKEDGEREIARIAEVLYGLSPRTALTLGVPVGDFGDMTIRYKNRFYQKDYVGVQNKVAWIAGVRLPTGSTSRGFGDGSTDYKFALTAGREATHFYWFSDVEYTINGEGDGDLKKGNEFNGFFSLGYRPGTISFEDGVSLQKEVDYYGIDPVFFAEFGYEHTSRSEQNGNGLANTGGDMAFWAPTALITYRNYMLKGGVKVPFEQNLNGSQVKLDNEWKLAVEYHFFWDGEQVFDPLFIWTEKDGR